MKKPPAGTNPCKGLFRSDNSRIGHLFMNVKPSSQTRPKTTLFMISSLDGKISSGDTDELDVDRDWKKIRGVGEGMDQYYQLEQQTDFVSFNTGRVMAKIGVNSRPPSKQKSQVSFVLVDNKPHLNEQGLRFLASWLKRVYVVTSNKKHPAFRLKKELTNISIILLSKKMDLKKLFYILVKEYKIKRMTIQSGGKMNAQLMRDGLIDRVSLVIAPLIVGGSTTPTLVDGESLHHVRELGKLVPLKLVKIEKLKHSFLHLTYKVIDKSRV
ncbi:MAG: dihydrofolate reductase family protein [Patescibacteria group bacterium]